MEKTTLGQALVERRIELGIDKANAAAMVGVTRATYAAYESDSRRLSVDGLPALRSFLDVAVEDFLEMYGATCVAQARVIILRDLFVSDALTSERPMPTTMMVKNVRDNEMSVVERVFFDVVTAKGHGVASPYVTQPSTEPTAVRASTSSVLGRFDDDTVFRSSSGTIVKKNEGKGKGKMKGSKSGKKKNRVKEKKRKGDKPKGKKKHEVKKKHKVKKKKRK
jgi:transcriptional regulator with XRE-family HTH domain